MRSAFEWLNRFLLALATLSTLSASLFAGIRPSFSLQYSSWFATDVVEARSTTERGVFEVSQTWKGSLAGGARIELPELAPKQTAAPIALYPTGNDLFRAGAMDASAEIPNQAAGSSIILFLIKSQAESITIDVSPSEETGSTAWKPAELLHDIKASVIWIDGEKLYSFKQIVNPGPSVLVPLGSSLNDVRREFSKIQGQRAAFDLAIAVTNPEERASRLKDIVKSEYFIASLDAIKELQICGAFSLPVIREMLDDRSFDSKAAQLIAAYARVGRESVASDLGRWLLQEADFWRTLGPRIDPEIYVPNERSDSPIRVHLARTIELIESLQQLHDAQALEAATELRDFWRLQSQSNLADYRGIADQCDKLIAHLQGVERN